MYQVAMLAAWLKSWADAAAPACCPALTTWQRNALHTRKPACVPSLLPTVTSSSPIHQRKPAGMHRRARSTREQHPPV